MFDSSSGVLGLDPATMGDEELTRHLLATVALCERAQAAVLAALGEWDARDLWALDGAVSAGQWLAARAPLSGREARGLARTARSLRATTTVASALAEGSINVGQAKALAGVRTRRTEELFAAHEPHLVKAAQSLGVDDTIRLAQRWLLQADTDGTAPDNNDQSARMSPGYEGRWRLEADLTAEGGEIFRSVLEQIMEELFHADDGAATGGAARRRADALVEMARRASAARDDQPASRPLIVVRTDLSDLVDLASRGGRVAHSSASTPDGAPLASATLRRLLCDADICRVVTNGDSEILDVGRASRTATTAQRRALTIRDGGCVFPGCDRPPGWCEAHHIIWWEHDGPTDLCNLCYLCSRHHHLIHQGRFHVQRDRDGRLVFTAANGAILQPAHEPLNPYATTWALPADRAG